MRRTGLMRSRKELGPVLAGKPPNSIASYESRRGRLPTFLLVDRGYCYFALKVWNVQNAESNNSLSY